MSAQDYIDFFISPKFRAGVDAFPAVDYGDYADPAALLAAFDLPGGSANYDNFNDPAITAALEQARGTANPDQRAALVARAEQLTMQQLPWIPDVEPDTVLVLGQGPDRRDRPRPPTCSRPGPTSWAGPAERCAGASSRAGWSCCWPACSWRAS